MSKSRPVVAPSEEITLVIAADENLLAKLDAWIASHVEPMSREEAVREILRAAITEMKTSKERLPVSGPVDAPMVRVGRKMKAANVRAKAPHKTKR